MQGMPARKLGANFSSAPQIGKLNALMWTATPRRGTSTWVPANWPFLPSAIAGPSWIRLPDGSSLLPMLAYANSVPAPPSMSIQLSARGAPVEVERQQRGDADAARVVDGLAEIDLVGVGMGDHAPVDRAGERRAG